MIIIFIFLFISCWSDFQKYVKGWSLENTNKLINNLFKFLEFLGNTSSTKMPKQFNFLQLSISGLLSVSFFPQPCFPIKIIFSFVYFQVCYYIQFMASVTAMRTNHLQLTVRWYHTVGMQAFQTPQSITQTKKSSNHNNQWE